MFLSLIVVRVLVSVGVVGVGVGAAHQVLEELMNAHKLERLVNQIRECEGRHGKGNQV